MNEHRNEAATAVASRPCAPVVAQVTVKPGAAGEAVDSLPRELTSGPPRLLVYRVQLMNASGRTAGASAAIPAAAGTGPAAVKSFRAHQAKVGVVLEWAPETSTSGDRVELERTVEEPAGAAPRGRAGASGANGLLASSREPAEVKLIAGNGATAADAGGAIDRNAEFGHTYRYTAWRVRSVTVDGQQLEVRGPVSSAELIKVQDVFPPDAPQGLVAVPGFSGQDNAAKPVIDLSWEPNAESRVAGYRVYRREAGVAEWQRISGLDALPTAGYRDSSVKSGAHYEYRVSAVGLNGLESAPSSVAEETTGTP